MCPEGVAAASSSPKLDESGPEPKNLHHAASADEEIPARDTNSSHTKTSAMPMWKSAKVLQVASASQEKTYRKIRSPSHRGPNCLLEQQGTSCPPASDGLGGVARMHSVVAGFAQIFSVV